MFQTISDSEGFRHFRIFQILNHSDCLSEMFQKEIRQIQKKGFGFQIDSDTNLVLRLHSEMMQTKSAKFNRYSEN